ncbi:gustatory receptor 28a, partial [Asbolus verrucosus]
MLYLGSLEKNPVTEGKLYNFNTLAKLLILVVTMFEVMVVYVLFALNYLYKNYFRDFINTLAEIDKILIKLGHEFNYNSEFLINVVVNLAGPLFTFCNVAMEVDNVKREKLTPIPPVLIFCHIFPFMLVHHGESQFVTANIILHSRFSVVNSFLGKLYERAAQESKYAGRQKKVGVISDLLKNWKSDEKILNSCIQCHDKLCDMCDVVNKIFGFIIIVGSVIQFNTIVFAFCYCYYSISIRPISTLGWFFWSLYRIYELTRKSVSAHICAKELKIFALQLTHRKVSFTALGLFPLDATFAFTVIGAATTYITIIYQFQ